MKSRTYGNLTQMTFMPHVFPINCYLVRENDGFTLIDTAISSSANYIIDAAKSLNAPIVRIALTHAHGDHAGSLDTLHEAFPNAEVLLSTREARLLQGDRSIDNDEPQIAPPGFKDSVKYTTQPTKTLVAGDRVWSLEVIACPGHTPGHVAFFDTRDRTLIAGDAFQIRGGIAVSGILRPLFPFPTFGTWHLPTALQSAKHLLAFNPKRLAVGHGNILDDPTDAMYKAIQVAERKIHKD